MMLLNRCLHRGHSALTLAHSARQAKQKVWKQLSVKDLFSGAPRQMAQLSSGDAVLRLDGRSGVASVGPSLTPEAPWSRSLLGDLRTPRQDGDEQAVAIFRLGARRRRQSKVDGATPHGLVKHSLAEPHSLQFEGEKFSAYRKR